ncbi:MAG: response regulator [Planctomycetes bacterium]|nr:response regulator [Planctomycetota bacterium]
MDQFETVSCRKNRLVVRKEDGKETLDLSRGCKTHRVLIIEDDRAFFDALAARLVRASVEPLWAKDGVEALDALREAEFDAVLVDLGLPRMNGYHVLEALRAEWPELPAFVMTGNLDPELHVKLRNWGATAFFYKPFRVEELLDLLDELA